MMPSLPRTNALAIEVRTRMVQAANSDQLIDKEAKKVTDDLPYCDTGDSQDSSKTRSSRKRRKPLFLVNTASSAENISRGWSRSDWQIHQPDLLHFTQLLGGLLLTTSLAVVSGFDAETQCIAHEQESYSLLDLVDDDNFQQTYAENSEDLDVSVDKCKMMFRVVLLPTGAATWLFGLMCLFHIHRFNRQRSQMADDTLSLVRKLFLLLVPLMCMQVYNISAILLSGGPLLQHLSFYSDASDNPYQNLAAVDQHGHVGLNANLYYTVWISLVLTMTLFYQTVTASARLARISAARKEHEMLPCASWDSDSHRSHRFEWYKSLYRLRTRTGFWTAALLTSLTIVASSQYVWSHVLWAFASNYSQSASYKTVCHIVSENSEYPDQLCRRTVGAWLSGVVGASLCATAIGMHLAGRYTAQNHVSMELPAWERILAENRLPLRTEIVLSVLLSLLFIANAVSCTGVQGPASSVGTLYYSSWLSFLLCVRICLGCLEEHHNLDEAEVIDAADNYHPADKVQPTVTGSVNGDSDHQQDTEEKDRKHRLRRYFFLSIFSLVCSASAWDAASNEDKLNKIQMYMIIAPLIVAAISGALFFVCLKLRFYQIVSRKHYIGTLLSAVCFVLCLSVLVSTMHSDDSWAVNGIGEILNANLYYFTWASILTAGIQMMSYSKDMLGIKKGGVMSLVWIGIGKTSFVILGASLHVWHTIADNCGFEEIQSGAVTFCSRTIVAIVISLTGMLVSVLVFTGRSIILACPSCRCHRFQAHVELVISLFCVFLFGAAVALITCIGGPGQSVGDLFYSTWLSFMVSIGIFVNCYEQLKTEDSPIDSDPTGSTNYAREGVMT